MCTFMANKGMKNLELVSCRPLYDTGEVLRAGRGQNLSCREAGAARILSRLGKRHC